MKTIFITIFQAVEAKNLLRTPVAETLLRDPEVELICLVPSQERADYYRREISHSRIKYEVVKWAPKGFFENFFSALKFHLIHTKTTDLRRTFRLDENGNYIAYAANFIINRLLANRPVRQLFRTVDARLSSDPALTAIFDLHKPSAVLLAHLFDDIEIAILREVKKRVIPSVGFVNSWDKLTARAEMRLLPDYLLVFNDIVKREAIRHADMPPDRILPVGLPQYDQYVTESPVSREAFAASVGLDPKKPILLVAPIGAAFSNSDWSLIDFLHSAVEEKKIAGELFVRFQPNDFVDEREIQKRPWLKYDLPGTRFGSERGGDWDLNAGELRHLTNTLANIDVLICYASSISVDAAFMDKPVINVNFEFRQGERLAKSPTYFYQTEHYKKALDAGGIRLVQSPDELVNSINTYLKNPDEDKEGREALVRSQCLFRDGKSGARLAEAVLKAIRA